MQTTHSLDQSVDEEAGKVQTEWSQKVVQCPDSDGGSHPRTGDGQGGYSDARVAAERVRDRGGGGCGCDGSSNGVDGTQAKTTPSASLCETDTDWNSRLLNCHLDRADNSHDDRGDICSDSDCDTSIDIGEGSVDEVSRVGRSGRRCAPEYR